MPNLFADSNDIFIDPDKDYSEELVGEGKKYADLQALARSRVEADATIARRERELAGLREELATRLKYEEFLDKLNSKGTTLPNTTDDDTNPPKPGLSQEQLDVALENKLKQYEANKIAENNLTLVHNKLTEAFGTNYSYNLRKKTEELGMSETFIKQLAATNPKALLKLLEVEGTTKSPNELFQAPPRNDYTSSSLSPSKESKEEATLEEMRRKQPEKYWSPEIQNKLFEIEKKKLEGR